MGFLAPTGGVEGNPCFWGVHLLIARERSSLFRATFGIVFAIPMVFTSRVGLLARASSLACGGVVGCDRASGLVDYKFI